MATNNRTNQYILIILAFIALVLVLILVKSYPYTMLSTSHFNIVEANQSEKNAATITDSVTITTITVGILTILITLFGIYMAVQQFVSFKRLKTEILTSAKSIEEFKTYIGQVRLDLTNNQKEVIIAEKQIKNSNDYLFEALNYFLDKFDELSETKSRENVKTVITEFQLLCGTYACEYNDRWSSLSQLSASGSFISLERLEEIWLDSEEKDELRRMALKAKTEIEKRITIAVA